MWVSAMVSMPAGITVRMLPIFSIIPPRIFNHDSTLKRSTTLGDGVERGVALPGDDGELLQCVREGGPVSILHRKKERAIGEISMCLRDGEMKKSGCFDSTDDVAAGVVDGDGGLGRGEGDGVGRSVVLDKGGEVLELGRFEGNLRVTDVGQ